MDIQNLGQRLEKAATEEEINGKRSKHRAQLDAEIKLIIKDIRSLLGRIEDAVPLINLAITTSGARLSTSLPSTVSPSRLLQASTFLTAGDTQYSMCPPQAVQVGPTFTLSVYLLFAGHVRPHDEEGVREMMWKEVMHKAKVKLRRIPMELMYSGTNGTSRRNHLRDDARADEYAYQILIIEDLDDGRVHSYDDGEPQPGPFEDVAMAGIRETVPIHEISKIFYADTGKILRIGSEGEANNPILLLKRDVDAIPPRRMMDRQDILSDNEREDESTGSEELNVGEQAQLDAQLLGGDPSSTPGQENTGSSENWRFPPDIDLEWMAFEVHHDESDSDDDDEDESATPPDNGQLNEKMANLNMDGKGGSSRPSPRREVSIPVSSSEHQLHTMSTISNPLFNNIRTSLSLLETLLRLTSLQQFQQQSHLSITDELLNFFLEESSTTGAGGDEDHRQHVRAEARRKVGWDPYDESPLKRRGEDYQYQGAGSELGSDSPSRLRMQSNFGSEYDRATPTPQSQSKTRRGGYEYSISSPSDSGRQRSTRRSYQPDTPDNDGGYSSSDPPLSPISPSVRPRGVESKRTGGLRRQIPSNKPYEGGSSSRPQSAHPNDRTGTGRSSTRNA